MEAAKLPKPTQLQHEPDRKQPQQVEPPARPDPDPRGTPDAAGSDPDHWSGVDGVLAPGQPVPVGRQPSADPVVTLPRTGSGADGWFGLTLAI
jgi:hypothetical protein